MTEIPNLLSALPAAAFSRFFVRRRQGAVAKEEMADPRAEEVPAPRHGPRADREQEGHLRKEKWPPRNENRIIPEDKKDIYMGSPFKSEYTTVKTKNKELGEIFDELRSSYKAINGAKPGAATSAATKEYKALLDKVEKITNEIRNEKGMPIPIPRKLKKIPKPKPRMG